MDEAQDWKPDERDLGVAQEQGYEQAFVEHLAAQFRDWLELKGRTPASPGAEFRRWLRRPKTREDYRAWRQSRDRDSAPPAADRKLLDWAWTRWLSLFRSCPGRLYQGGYVATDDCRSAMESITAAAEGHARQDLAAQRIEPSELSPRAQDILTRWFKGYLRDDGRQGFLAEKRHPLRYLARELNTYGAPPIQQSLPVRPVEPAPAVPKASEEELQISWIAQLEALRPNLGLAAEGGT